MQIHNSSKFDVEPEKKRVSLDFCNVLIVQGKSGRLRAIRFMYFNGVPVILSKDPLFANSHVAKLGGKIVSGEINLIDGHAIFLHFRYFKPRVWLQSLLHEFGHIKMKHHLIPLEKGFRLKEVSEGRVLKEELDADRFAALRTGKERYLEFLNYLLRSSSLTVQRSQEFVDQYPGSKSISYKADRLSKARLAKEEILMRIEAIKSLS